MVNIYHSIEQLWMQPSFIRHMGQRAHVLGKTTPPVSQTGIQEGSPDALIVAHTYGHFFYIGPQAFANLGYFVNKGDLCRQEGVGRVLDHFSRIQVGDLYTRAQRQIERSNLARSLRI